GTTMLADIASGAASSMPLFLTPAGDRPLFGALDAEAGCEVWQTRGGRPRRLDDVEPGPDSSSPGSFTASGGRVFFTADTAATGNELFALAACNGDCDASAVVTIDELVRAV